MTVGTKLKCLTSCSVLTAGKDYAVTHITPFHYYVVADDGIEMGVPPGYFGLYGRMGTIPDIDRMNTKIAQLKSELTRLMERSESRNKEKRKKSIRQREVYEKFKQQLGKSSQSVLYWQSKYHELRNSISEQINEP